MIYDAIIIGAGPAGITATVYAVRKGMRIAVISKDIGGQVTKTSVVENYTGYQEITGEELAKKFNEHMKEFKLDFKQTKVRNLTKDNNIFTVDTEKEKFQGKTLIIATGAKPRELEVEGEKEFKNKGVTYCATCDAPLFTGKDVAVIGGGNSALESGLQLVGIANKIYMINKNESFKGDKILIEKIKANPKVKIINNAYTEAILGEKFVRQIRINQKGKQIRIDIQGVFVNIGYIPNTRIAENLVRLNSRGEIEIDSFGQTNVPGIFAAGDCTDIPYKQIITAAGAGAIAALSAFNYLSKT
jgi:thioredoxin-disulfide reductase